MAPLIINDLCIWGYGAQSAHKVRGILSSIPNGGEGDTALGQRPHHRHGHGQLEERGGAEQFALGGREQRGERLQREVFQERPDLVLRRQRAGAEEFLHLRQAAVARRGVVHRQREKQVLQTRIAAGVEDAPRDLLPQCLALLPRQLGDGAGDFGHAELGVGLFLRFAFVHAVERHVEQMVRVGQIARVVRAGELEAAGEEQVRAGGGALKRQQQRAEGVEVFGFEAVQGARSADFSPLQRAQACGVRLNSNTAGTAGH